MSLPNGFNVDIVTVASVVTTIVLARRSDKKDRKKDEAARVAAEEAKAKALAAADIKRAEEFATLAQSVKDMKDKFDKETGGNSGGFREALNGVKSTIEKVDQSVVEVRGLVFQHLEAHSNV